MSADRDILAMIPGELLAPERYPDLPPAGPDAPIATHVLTEWNGRQVRITFAKMKSRKGKTSRWFWSPASAAFVGLT